MTAFTRCALLLSVLLGLVGTTAPAPAPAPACSSGGILADTSSDQCQSWLTSEPNLCLKNRTSMMAACQQSCKIVAGVTVDSFTPDQIQVDASAGYLYVTMTAAGRPNGDGDDNEEEIEVLVCKDDVTECAEWAENGDCYHNDVYMAQHCARTCHVCFAEGTTVVNFGVPQLTDYHGDAEINQNIADNIQKTVQYLTNHVLVEEQFNSLRRECYNFDHLCSYYAAQGWCESNDLRWMQENCAPACQACMTSKYWLECGSTPDMVDAFKEGGIVEMFERVIDGYPHEQITVLSYPESRREFLESRKLRVAQEHAVDWSANYSSFEEWIEKEKDWVENLMDHEKPWALTLDNFLSDEECDFLVEQGHRLGFDASAKGVSLDDSGLEMEEGIIDEGRTSSNTYCDEECSEHPIGKRIIDRMSSLTGLPKANSESLQLLKYEIGEHYEEHHDTSYHWDEIYCGHRVLTFFLYLSDVEEGGETRLNTLNKDVIPEKGKALLWPSVRNDDVHELEQWGWHQALPIIKGRKFGANAWYHLRKLRDDDFGCM